MFVRVWCTLLLVEYFWNLWSDYNVPSFVILSHTGNLSLKSG